MQFCITQLALPSSPIKLYKNIKSGGGNCCCCSLLLLLRIPSRRHTLALGSCSSCAVRNLFACNLLGTCLLHPKFKRKNLLNLSVNIAIIIMLKSVEKQFPLSDSQTVRLHSKVLSYPGTGIWMDGSLLYIPTPDTSSSSPQPRVNIDKRGHHWTGGVQCN